MTDALAERLAAYASTRDDSDWLDVRRRVRRRRARVAVPIAATSAAALAAAAFAASGGWVFSSHDRQVTGRTTVAVAGRTWRVSYSASPRFHASFCLRATSGGATRSRCTESSPHLGPPLGGMKLSVPGGQIWAGAVAGFTRRVAIVDEAGHRHAAQAVKPPKGTKTPFRYWVITLGTSPARSITAYGADGRSITTRLR